MSSAAPWEDEPDDFYMTASGLTVCGHRSHFGCNWCGYVGVPKSHPLYGHRFKDVVPHPAGFMERPLAVDDVGIIGLLHGLATHQTWGEGYPVHAWHFQYQVNDLAYVQMLMQKAGIYSYIVETEHGDMTVFADDIDHYIYDEPQRIVPYRETAGLEADGVEAVTAIKTHTVTVPQAVIVADYNPESAWERWRQRNEGSSALLAG